MSTVLYNTVPCTLYVQGVYKFLQKYFSLFSHFFSSHLIRKNNPRKPYSEPHKNTFKNWSLKSQICFCHAQNKAQSTKQQCCMRYTLHPQFGHLKNKFSFNIGFSNKSHSRYRYVSLPIIIIVFFFFLFWKIQILCRCCDAWCLMPLLVSSNNRGGGLLLCEAAGDPEKSRRRSHLISLWAADAAAV